MKNYLLRWHEGLLINAWLLEAGGLSRITLPIVAQAAKEMGLKLSHLSVGLDGLFFSSDATPAQVDAIAQVVNDYAMAANISLRSVPFLFQQPEPLTAA